MTKEPAQPASEKKADAPTPEERAVIKKVLDTRKSASAAPRLKVEKRTVSFDHPDQLIGHALLQNALGAPDFGFTTGLLEQLARASQRDGKLQEVDLNFMVSFINGIEPRDQIESTLAAQMAAVHMEMMKFAERMNFIETIQQQDSAARAFNQLARTFAVQLEALKRYRSGGKQKVTVQHVTVGEGGQAIVGNVTQGRSAAADGGVPSQPSALTKAETAPMHIIESKSKSPVQVSKKK